jgi:serine/threonine protein kinase
LDPQHPAAPSNKPSPEWQAAGGNDPLIGTTIDNGKYTILGQLGKGGMSIVYKARHNAMDRIVAIKTLKMQMMSNPSIVSRFEREVKLLSKLDHPNVVTVYNCVMVQNQPYFVMDCLTGQSLQELLRAEGRMSPQRAQQIFIQCCAAVEHAHRKGVIHRDIKPGNIMITPGSGGRDMVKVVDFGLARLAEDAQKLTQSGEIWGSPLYMSPEQAAAQELDARSDIYSLGTVMFETLTGSPPFRGKNFIETMQMQVNQPTPSMHDVAPAAKVPKALEDVVRKALEKEPENRFQTMAAIKDALLMAVPNAQSQAETGVEHRDPQSAIPTMVLKRPAINGYNYQPRKKGWSGKLLVPPAIALIIMLALGMSFRSLFWQQSPPSTAADERGGNPAPSAPVDHSPTVTPPTVPQQQPAPTPQVVDKPSAPSQKPAVKPPSLVKTQPAHEPHHTAPPSIPHKEHPPARRHVHTGDVWEELREQKTHRY